MLFVQDTLRGNNDGWGLGVKPGTGLLPPASFLNLPHTIPQKTPQAGLGRVAGFSLAITHPPGRVWQDTRQAAVR